MLDSIPLPWQAIVWPIIGAAIVLIIGRLLPNWLCRLVAFFAAAASLLTLWSLDSGAAAPVTISWSPLNIFRAGLVLRPDGLSSLVGLLLCVVVAAAVLGIRGARTDRVSWHGLILVGLAGGLLLTMAANLLTLALGSALIDLALIAMVVLGAGGAGRVVWRMIVPGIASTLVIMLGAVQMSTQVGTVSLLAADIPQRVLIFVSLAGLLRALIFPLHPRDLRSPEHAITLIVLTAAGVYLLARSQAIAPLLAGQAWLPMLSGSALLAGGLLAWAGGGAQLRANSAVEVEGDDLPAAASKRSIDGVMSAWLGIIIHQVGLVLIFVAFLGGGLPWPLLSLALALSALAIWWSAAREPAAAYPRWMVWSGQRLEPTWARARSRLAALVPASDRWSDSWLRLRGAPLLPAIALLSLAGIPFTAGALGRWPFYAALLERGNAFLLIASLIADSFLVAALWAVLRASLRQSESRRLLATLAVLLLDLLLIVLGLAPGWLPTRLALEQPDLSGISIWGLGLIYVLPWLLGSWLARIDFSRLRHFDYVQRLVSLNWFFRLIDWLGQRLLSSLYWLAQVGEGDGWWGWALIILALGAIFLTGR